MNSPLGNNQSSPIHLHLAGMQICMGDLYEWWERGCPQRESPACATRRETSLGFNSPFIRSNGSWMEQISCEIKAFSAPVETPWRVCSKKKKRKRKSQTTAMRRRTVLIKHSHTCSLISCSLLLCSRMSCSSCMALSSSLETSTRASSKLRFRLCRHTHTHRRCTHLQACCCGLDRYCHATACYTQTHTLTHSCYWDSRCTQWCRWRGLAPGCPSESQKPSAPHPSGAAPTPGQSFCAGTWRSPAPSEHTRAGH